MKKSTKSGIDTVFNILALLCSVFLVVFTALGVAGCFSRTGNDGERYTTNYTVGIIKTTVHDYSTYIEFYDDKLNLVNKLEYPYASLENAWSKPITADHVAYMAHRGTFESRSTRQVIGIDLETGEVCEYHVDMPFLLAVGVMGKNLYAFNNQNGNSYMARLDIESGETLGIVEIPGTIKNIVSDGERLYVFREGIFATPQTAQGNAVMYVLDADMDVIQEFEIEGFHNVIDVHGFVSDRLYFVGSNYYAQEDGQENTGMHYERALLYWSSQDSLVHPTLLTIMTNAEELLPVAEDNGVLYVLKRDESKEVGSILMLDADTGKTISSLGLGAFSPHYAQMVDGTLYVAGTDYDAGMRKVAKYVVGDDGLVLVCEALISEGEPSRPGRYYISGIIASWQR